MAINPTTREMSDAHEARLAAAFDGTVQPGSGNQWHHQGDVRNAHDLPFAFTLDGKSTMGKGITVTLEMIAKIIEQAQGERPGFGLRWYGSGDMSDVLHDFVLLLLSDVEEMLTAARAWAGLEAELGGVSAQEVIRLLDGFRDAEAQIARLRGELDRARGPHDRDQILGSLIDEEKAESARLREENDGLQAELATVRLQLSRHLQGMEVPDYIPMLPWTTVHITNLRGRQEKSGVHYDAEGHRQTFDVGEIRVERMPDSSNRPRLMVNNKRVSHGDLYVDGHLRTRAATTRKSIEVG